jgi:Icc protein
MSEDIMKFIHLSDTHLLPGPQLVHGIDPCARLEAAVSSICANFPDAEFCMMTGDIAELGDRESYLDARRILGSLPFPWHGLMGNHDIRSVARDVLVDFPWQPNGFLQYQLDTSAGHFIILDSLHSENVHSGQLCEHRLDWLRNKLELAKEVGKDVFLFMHHVPFDIGIPWLDRIKMENGDELWEILSKYSNIRHMFFGHVHRPIHGSWHGIPFSTVRATAHQVALTFGVPKRRFIGENPSYAVVLIDDNQVVIHDHSFMEEHLPTVE